MLTYHQQTITLVSNRGVWMAHFWETYSNRVRYDRETFDENSDEPPDHPVFEQRVLAFILGQPVNDPAPNFDKPYIPPTGPSPDPNLFNRDTDETKLFISTPIPLGQQLSLRYGDVSNFHGPWLIMRTGAFN